MIKSERKSFSICSPNFRTQAHQDITSRVSSRSRSRSQRKPLGVGENYINIVSELNSALDQKSYNPNLMNETENILNKTKSILKTSHNFGQSSPNKGFYSTCLKNYNKHKFNPSKRSTLICLLKMINPINNMSQLTSILFSSIYYSFLGMNSATPLKVFLKCACLNTIQQFDVRAF